jgi:hypothetical protein
MFSIIEMSAMMSDRNTPHGHVMVTMPAGNAPFKRDAW